MEPRIRGLVGRGHALGREPEALQDGLPRVLGHGDDAIGDPERLGKHTLPLVQLRRRKELGVVLVLEIVEHEHVSVGEHVRDDVSREGQHGIGGGGGDGLAPRVRGRTSRAATRPGPSNASTRTSFRWRTSKSYLISDGTSTVQCPTWFRASNSPRNERDRFSMPPATPGRIHRRSMTTRMRSPDQLTHCRA